MDRQRMQDYVGHVSAYRASGKKPMEWAAGHGVPLRSLASWCAHAGAGRHDWAGRGARCGQAQRVCIRAAAGQSATAQPLHFASRDEQGLLSVDGPEPVRLEDHLHRRARGPETTDSPADCVDGYRERRAQYASIQGFVAKHDFAQIAPQIEWRSLSMSRCLAVKSRRSC